MTTLIVVGIGILLLLFILFILFGILVIQRLRKMKKQRKMDHYMTSREADWYAYLIEEAIDVTELAPKNDIEREAADNILVRYRRNFYSKKIHYQIFNFAALYLEEYYRDGLNDRHWSIRMNTLQRILFLNLHFLIDDVLKMTKSKRSKTKEEWLLIYKIIIKMNPKTIIPYVIRPAVPFGEFDYRRLLSDIDEIQLEQFVYYFEDLSKVLQYVIIDSIGYKYFFRFIPLLENCLKSDDVELRIRTLKAFANLKDFPSSSVITPFVESPVWEERLMVAKVYANAPIEVSQTTLEALLEDPVYDIRSQAARSLQMIQTGEERLKRFIQQSEDAYAIEMAAAVIQEE